MIGSPNYFSSRSSDSAEEGVLNTLWEDYENAHDQVCPLSLVDRPFLLVCPLGLGLACVQQGMFYNENKMYFSRLTFSYSFTSIKTAPSMIIIVLTRVVATYNLQRTTFDFFEIYVIKMIA
jgi:hypothetical protein